MGKLYKENGFLSECGEDTFRQFLDKEISVLLNSAKNESELRIIGALIHKRVGDAVSDRIRSKNEIQAKFAIMTDQQFNAYLKAKYGDKWVLVSLTEEEVNRLHSLTKEVKSL